MHRQPALEQQLKVFIPGNAINAVAIQFNTDAFDDVLFTQHNLKKPEGFERWVQNRKAEYLAGRLAAKISLNTQMDIPTGKHREPIWPEGFSGSISHHHNLALAITSSEKNRRLGVDVEALMSEETFEQTKQQFLSVSELDLIQAAPAAVQYWLPTAVFSAKESFFKAMFALVNCYFDFDAIECVGFNKQALVFRLKNAPPELTRYSALRTEFLVHCVCPYNKLLNTEIVTLVDIHA